MACSIRKKRKNQHTNWQRHSDKIFVEINDVRHYLWRAVDHKGKFLNVIFPGVVKRILH
ncbi:DDE-type integrase/transposase/recombinase [Bartonella apis]|uniref:DDE-type integrase/transposase/recombinase n=1 Tax=Bartonella apis TaxID=1686310 RepID=UPI003CC7FAC2